MPYISLKAPVGGCVLPHAHARVLQFVQQRVKGVALHQQLADDDLACRQVVVDIFVDWILWRKEK